MYHYNPGFFQKACYKPKKSESFIMQNLYGLGLVATKHSNVRFLISLNMLTVNNKGFLF